LSDRVVYPWVLSRLNGNVHVPYGAWGVMHVSILTSSWCGHK